MGRPEEIARKRGTLRIWGVLSSVQRVALVVTGVGVTGIIAAACILRFFKINFIGFEEILIIVAFWLYMLGCANGAFEKSHITANVVELFLKHEGVKRKFLAVRDVLTAALCAVMFVWALILFLESCGFGGLKPPMTTVFRIPMALGYLSVAAGLGLSAFYFICHAFESIAQVIAGGKR